MVRSHEFLARLTAVAEAPNGGAVSPTFTQTAEALRLPTTHVSLLSGANGLVGFDGYFRLFGIGRPTSALADIETWNADATWRFAWPLRLREFLCFGETAWGDQYAYRVAELGEASPKVYLLEHVTMGAEILAPNFEAFVEAEFLRNCKSPYDSVLVRVHARLGALRYDDHIAHVPSILITDDENPDRVARMPAVSSMIVNGDLARQLADEKQSRTIKAVEPYEDELGRMRLRVVFGGAKGDLPDK